MTCKPIIATSFALLIVLAAGGSAAVVGTHGARASGTLSNETNPLVRENLRRGSTSW